MEEYKPIDSAQTEELIKKSKEGDESATNLLISGNFPLIKAIVRGYLNKGVDYDDLYQIGCVGFLKAIKNGLSRIYRISPFSYSRILCHI